MAGAPDSGSSPHSISAGGVAARHPASEELPVFAAPTVGSVLNTKKSTNIPIACWRVDDLRFDFDSSFLNPGIREELQSLAVLIDEHPGSPLSVFGHADPAGDDAYNKILSGRRAAAIYALLTRRTEIWEDLFSNTGTFGQPSSSDTWGKRVIQVMLDETGDDADGTSADAFLHDKGKRQQLFSDYMDSLCTFGDGGDGSADAAAPVDGPSSLKLEVTDFLAKGIDAAGKGDFQGCSEFNPILIFSDDDQQRFARATDKAERNAANAPNRRVMVLLFRKGSLVDPARWPCPRAKDGVAACQKRFFSDGELRRSRRLPDQPRQFEDNQDTFACRFYQRMVTASPCERIVKTVQIRLYDRSGQFIPSAPCQISLDDGSPFSDKANDQGVVTLRDLDLPVNCSVDWGFVPPAGQEPDLIFSLDMILKSDDADQNGEASRKLNNLGYISPDLAENTTAFQRDYGQLAQPALGVSGNLDGPTAQLLNDVYQACADDLRNTPVT